MTDRAVLFCRLSQRTDTNVPNLDQQEQELRDLADRNAWYVVEVIREIASAFENEGNRGGFARLVELVRAGECDVVAARHPDRFSRDDVESAIFRRDLERAGVRMVTAHGEVDLSSPAGSMLATITGAVAQYESRVKRERLLRKHEQLAAAGKRAGGGTRPFGFEQDFMTVVDEEAGVIRDVAERLLAGRTIASEVRRLNTTGIRTSTGAPWTREVLGRMMQSGRISGRREHHGKITATAVWPSIITPEQSDRLRQIAEVNRASRKRANRKYLLTGGVGRCGNEGCGAALVARPVAGGRRAYVCARENGGCGKLKILADEFEAWVGAAVADAYDSGRLAELARSREQDPSDASARLRDVEHRLSVLAVDFGRRRLTEEAYRSTLDALDDERQAALAELKLLATTDPLEQITGRVATAWGELDLQQRRELIERALSAVVVSPAVRGRNTFDETRISGGLIWRI